MVSKLVSEGRKSREVVGNCVNLGIMELEVMKLGVSKSGATGLGATRRRLPS